MGKKSKKKAKDIWDLTPEQQMKLSNESYEKVTDILGLVKGGVKPSVTNAGFTLDLDSTIASDLMCEKPKKNKRPKYENTEQYRRVSPNVMDEGFTYRRLTTDDALMEEEESDKEEAKGEFIQSQSNIPEEPKQTNENDVIGTVRPIKYIINQHLGRVILNDGISPTTIALKALDFAEISDRYTSENFDSDYLGEVITALTSYIISCKHPSAILTAELFDELFGHITSLDHNKFMVLSKSYGEIDLFFLYYIDHESEASFIKLIRENNYDNLEALKMVVTMAYAAGHVNNIFMVDDEDYVEAYMEYCKKTHSMARFMNTIVLDSQTKISDELLEDNYVRLNVCELDDVQRKARELLLELAEDEDDDENDEQSTRDATDLPSDIDSEDENNDSGLGNKSPEESGKDSDENKDISDEVATTIDLGGDEDETEFIDPSNYAPESSYEIKEGNKQSQNNGSLVMERITR